MLCLILLDSFVDVELERKGALLCTRLRLILFLSHCQMSFVICLFICGGKRGGGGGGGGRGQVCQRGWGLYSVDERGECGSRNNPKQNPTKKI